MLNLEDRKYSEGWISKNKRICVLTKHLLSGESYKLIQAKVFDVLEQYSERTERNIGMQDNNGPSAGMHSQVTTIDIQ